jgi:N-acetyl-anhydromuramyl-L-alanine amidase AmpD
MPAEMPPITVRSLPTTQYVTKDYEKSQIYLHHTASDHNPFGVVSYWTETGERVGTAFIIAGEARSASTYQDGDIIQCFPSKKAAWHLGLKQVDLNRGKPGNETSEFLNLNTIGIEICNWGYLVESPKGFKSYAGAIVPDMYVCEYETPFRGYRHYERYSDAQLESARKLLLYLCDKYDITKTFKGIEIFDIDKRALRGENGIFTHVSVRTDKYDCHPQPELIQMLQSL